MEKILSPYASYIYAILRVVAGFLFMWHGTQKLLGYPPAGGPAGEMSALMIVGGVIELVGGIMIMVGFLTSIAAFIASGMMAVAYFMAHFSLAAFLPIQNRGELAVIYCFVFLYIAARGSGPLSVDAALGRSGGDRGKHGT